MKKIGEGYYYKVYDLGNGRIVKKRKSKLRMMLFIWIVNLFLPRSFNEYIVAIKNLPKIPELYKKLIERKIDMSLLGNPKFLNAFEYEQDNVVILNNVFSNDTQNNEKIIDNYIILIKQFWKYGCHESVYNFTINNGLTQDGKVVLVDFNEMTFDKSAVVDEITCQHWLSRRSYKHDMPRSLQTYFKRRMSEEVTVEQLEALWDRSSE